MALGGNLLTAQLASIVGLYGLTVIAIRIFSAPAVLGDKSALRGADAPPPARDHRGHRSLFAAFVDLRDARRLANATPDPVAGVKLRIMQPNLAQDEKFRPENKGADLTHYLTLSAASTTRSLRPRRCHRSHLAGIGVSLHFVARCRSSWRKSERSCRKIRSSSPVPRATGTYRSGPPGGPRAAPAHLFQCHSSGRQRRVIFSTIMTRCILCRSANICPFRSRLRPARLAPIRPYPWRFRGREPTATVVRARLAGRGRAVDLL